MFVAKYVNDRDGAFKVRGQRVKDTRLLNLVFAIVRGIDVRPVRGVAETIVEIPRDGWINGKAIVAAKKGGELRPIPWIVYKVGKNVVGIGDSTNHAATGFGWPLGG